MKIMGFMPTLGRPQLVEEIICMWNMQTYQDRFLIIYDTANQLPQIEGDRWRIVHQGELPWSMGTTCNVGIRLSDAPLIARIDDDDHYYPWHLEACVEALKHSHWSCPYETWDAQYGDIRLIRTYRDAHGPRGVAYAGAWAFRREAFDVLGGYKETAFREEECEFRDRLAARFGLPGNTISEKFPTASYLYAANHDRVVHYGQCTDDQRRKYQRQQWPKVTEITPRWPRSFMLGLPRIPELHKRPF